MTGTRETEEETPVLARGKKNTGATQKRLITAPTHAVIPACSLHLALPSPGTRASMGAV